MRTVRRVEMKHQSSGGYGWYSEALEDPALIVNELTKNFVIAAKRFENRRLASFSLKIEHDSEAFTFSKQKVGVGNKPRYVLFQTTAITDPTEIILAAHLPTFQR